MLEVIDSVLAYTLEVGDVVSVNGSLQEIVSIDDSGENVVVLTEADEELSFSPFASVDIYGA